MHYVDILCKLMCIKKTAYSQLHIGLYNQVNVLKEGRIVEDHDECTVTLNAQSINFTLMFCRSGVFL